MCVIISILCFFMFRIRDVVFNLEGDVVGVGNIKICSVVLNLWVVLVGS